MMCFFVMIFIAEMKKKKNIKILDSINLYNIFFEIETCFFRIEL